MNFYQICFYVPETHLETVKNALFSVGAGQYKGYDQCCWQVKGEGQFRALTGSKPYLGKPKQLERVVEYKVEMVCHNTIIKKAVQMLLDTHPYEQPAYAIYQILTPENLK